MQPRSRSRRPHKRGNTGTDDGGVHIRHGKQMGWWDNLPLLPVLAHGCQLCGNRGCYLSCILYDHSHCDYAPYERYDPGDRNGYDLPYDRPAIVRRTRPMCTKVGPVPCRPEKHSEPSQIRQRASEHLEKLRKSFSCPNTGMYAGIGEATEMGMGTAGEASTFGSAGAGAGLSAYAAPVGAGMIGEVWVLKRRMGRRATRHRRLRRNVE